LQRQEQLTRLTRDSLDQIAINVADKYYRPLLDATARANMYIDQFERRYEVFRGEREYDSTGKFPPDISAEARQEIERGNEARKNSLNGMKRMFGEEAAIKTYQETTLDIMQKHTRAVVSNLKLLNAAIAQFLASGYLTELLAEESGANLSEADIKTHQLMIQLMSVHDIRLMENMVDDNAAIAMSVIEFLRPRILLPLMELRKLVPWEKFCVKYRDKLRVAIGS
jgi:hypothetical protein